MAAIEAFRSPELSALLRLAKGDPLNMRQFCVAAQVSPATGRAVLDALAGMGLVDVERTRQGATEIVEIRLSKRGERVARHVVAIDGLLG